LAGGVTEIAKAVNNNKMAQRQPKELKYHNRVEGSGLSRSVQARTMSFEEKNIKKTLKKQKNAKGRNNQLQQLANVVF